MCRCSTWGFLCFSTSCFVPILKFSYCSFFPNLLINNITSRFHLSPPLKSFLPQTSVWFLEPSPLQHFKLKKSLFIFWGKKGSLLCWDRKFIEKGTKSACHPIYLQNNQFHCINISLKIKSFPKLWPSAVSLLFHGCLVALRRKKDKKKAAH